MSRIGFAGDSSRIDDEIAGVNEQTCMFSKFSKGGLRRPRTEGSLPSSNPPTSGSIHDRSPPETPPSNAVSWSSHGIFAFFTQLSFMSRAGPSCRNLKRRGLRQCVYFVAQSRGSVLAVYASCRRCLRLRKTRLRLVVGLYRPRLDGVGFLRMVSPIDYLRYDPPFMDFAWRNLGLTLEAPTPLALLRRVL